MIKELEKCSLNCFRWSISYYNAEYKFPQVFHVSYLCVCVYVYERMYSICVC